MKPFSIDCNNAYIRRTVFGLLWVVLIFISGCGGFSGGDTLNSDGSPSDNIPVVFFQGQVQFPGGANASIQKVSAKNQNLRLNIAQTIQNVQGVNGASIGLFKSSDLFFQNNLLKSGEVIKTNSNGQFSITDNQLKTSIFEGLKEAFIVRASFNDYELSSLVTVDENSSPVEDSIAINVVSDGAIRYLREEVAQKVGGISDNADISTEVWKNDFNKLVLEFSDRRTEIQQKFILSNFNVNDYLITSSLNNRNAGQQWANEIDRLAGIESEWERIAVNKEELKLNAITSRSLPAAGADFDALVRRRKLQLFYTFLEFGFAVSNGSGEIFVKDHWQQLEESLAPQFKANVDSVSIRSNFDSQITNEDLDLFPIPGGVIEFSLEELSSFGLAGPKSEEKKVLIAQDLGKRPWVTLAAIDVLKTQDLKLFASIRDVISACANIYLQRRFSIERIQDQQVSGGLAFFGELVEIPEVYGGAHAPSNLFTDFWEKQTFNSDFNESFETLLEAEEVYLSMIRDVYLSEYAKLIDRSQSITSPNNGYPDPVSINATRNLVFRNSQSNSDSLFTRTPKVARKIDLVRKSFESIYKTLEGPSNGLKVNLDTKRNLSQLIPWFSMLLNHSFPLQTQLGFYKDVQGSVVGKNPRYENLRVLRFEPAYTDQLWNNFVSHSGLSIATDNFLQSYSDSLKSMSINTLPWLSVAKSNRVSVVASGVLFLKNEYPNSPTADNFPVLATVQSNTSTQVISFSALAESGGRYEFSDFPLKGDELYHFNFVVKNSPESLSATVVLSYSYYVAGFEERLDLPEFFMESQYRVRATTYDGNLDSIQPENLAPEIQLDVIPDVTSGIIPISVTVKDPESQPVDIEFKFTSGFDLTVTTSVPKISISSIPTSASLATTFPSDGFLLGLQSSASGYTTTIYWHSIDEPGPGGSLGLSSIDDVRVQLSVYESDNRVIKGNSVFSNFFDLDNEAPTISFNPPLKDLRISNLPDYPESVLKNITLTGSAIDTSQIQKIFVRNISLDPSDLTTYLAFNTGDNFGTWRIESVPLEPGVENFLEFFVEDIYGNQNSQPVTATVLSIDSSPPKLQLKKITIASVRNVPSLTSLISESSFNFSTMHTTFNAAPAVEMTVTSTSTNFLMGTLTTDTIKFEGVAKDVNGVSIIRVNGDTASFATTDGIHYTWSRTIDDLTESTLTDITFTAIDKKNNNSGTTNPNDSAKLLSAITLQISTIDYSPPCVNIISPDNGELKTGQIRCGGSEALSYAVTTSQYDLLGSADDRSRITTFVVCPGQTCIPITSNYINWSASLPLSEASTNWITGHIEDEFGFRETFTTSSPLVKLNLNDITPPSMIVTSISGLTLSTPYIFNSSSPDVPLTGTEVINVTNCTSTTCAIEFSGDLIDNFGIDLLSNTPNDFNGFKLRMCNLNEQGCDPSLPDRSQESWLGSVTTLLPNGVNFTQITTTSVPAFISQTNGRQTRVPFNAEVVLEHDGYWPMQVTLADDSIDQFDKYSKPSIRKSNIFIFKKDTMGPVVSSVSLANSEYVTGGSIAINFRAEDELSLVTGISVDSADLVSTQLETSGSLTSPWSEFVTLDSSSSVDYQIIVTVTAGLNQQLTLNVIDDFGNVTSVVRDFSVFPIFNSTISLREKFPEPIGIAFGGDFLDQVVVGDHSLDIIEEFSLNAISINTFTGNQSISQPYYGAMTDLLDFDYFSDTLNNDESIVVLGKFSDGEQQANNYEAVRFVKEKSSPSLLNKFKIEGSTVIPGSSYHVLRSNALSNESDTFTTGSLIKFAPKLESVIYAYKPTDANIPQLIRYVNGFSSPITPEEESNGGAADSTGISNSVDENARLSSQVRAIVVTQVHIEDFNAEGGVSQSKEYVFLADAGLQRIVRFLYNNTPPDIDIGFSVLPSISLTAISISTGLTVSIVPVAMDVEQSGSVAYIANATEIYKLDISGSEVTNITSFGGYGFGDGKFENISYIKGRRAVDESTFSEIYVADSSSNRISVFSTNGEFIRYFGQNFYGLGGIKKPSLIGVKNDQWFLVDDQLDSIDFYTSQDNAESRQSTGDSTGSVGIQDFTSSLAMIYADNEGFEDLSNFLNVNYTNTSAELFKTVTSELFYLQSPNSLKYVVQRNNSFFSATIANSQRLVVVNNIDESPQRSTLFRGQQNFEDVIDMTLVRDNNTNLIFVLEHDSSDDPRVQIIPFQNQSIPNLFGSLPSTNITALNTATGICSYTSGIVVIGQGNSEVAIARFPSGTKSFPNNWTFEFPTLLNLSGTPMNLTSPSEIDCKGSEMAIVDEERILVYEIPTELTQGVKLKQEILSTDPVLSSTNQLSRLTPPIELQFFNDDLYVLEKSRSRILKYDLK